MYQAKYPESLTELKVTRPLRMILEKAEKLENTDVDIWDGDLTNLPDNWSNVPTETSMLTNNKWTIKILQSILRFFRLHNVRGKQTKLKGQRVELITRVWSLLSSYVSLTATPNIH